MLFRSDFDNIVRTTSSGAVALIVRPPIHSVPWQTDHIHDRSSGMYDSSFFFGAAAQHEWPGRHVAGPCAHHALSSRHASSRSHGHNIQDSGEESDEAYVHTAAFPDVLIWQQVLATSDSPAGPNAHLSNAAEAMPPLR